MPNPTIGEIIQNIFSNDLILDELEDRGWYVDINTVNEEELSVLKSPNKKLKIRQWDWPNTVSGRWEEEIRKIHSTYMRQERRV